MKHSELPGWLQPVLPATRHRFAVEYFDDDIHSIVTARHSIGRIDGLTFCVTAEIPGAAGVVGVSTSTEPSTRSPRSATFDAEDACIVSGRNRGTGTSPSIPASCDPAIFRSLCG